eukprot:COSAG05_NODE_647_length_8113_cov_15.485900_4_plen_206_part_00
MPAAQLVSVSELEGRAEGRRRHVNPIRPLGERRLHFRVQALTMAMRRSLMMAQRSRVRAPTPRPSPLGGGNSGGRPAAPRVMLSFFLIAPFFVVVVGNGCCAGPVFRGVRPPGAPRHFRPLCDRTVHGGGRQEQVYRGPRVGGPPSSAHAIAGVRSARLRSDHSPHHRRRVPQCGDGQGRLLARAQAFLRCVCPAGGSQRVRGLC